MGSWRRASSTRTCTSVQGGLEHIRCDLTGLDGRDEYLAAVASYAARTSRAGMDPGRRMVDDRLSGRHPDGGRSGSGGGRSTGVPAQPGSSRRLGEYAGAGAGGGAGGHPGSTARAVRTRRRRARRPARCTRAPCTWWPGTSRPPRSRSTTGRCWPGRPICIRSVSSAGRTRSSATTPGWGTSVRSTCGRPSAAHSRRSVVGALWWERDLGLEQIASLVQRRSELSRGRFQASRVKIMQDGVAENGTAAMSVPYLDDHGRPTANRGHSFLEPEQLNAAITALSAQGFPVHVHAIGDRAVREALDAFAFAAGERRGSPASDCAPAGDRSDRSAPVR